MVQFLRHYLQRSLGDHGFPWEGSNWTDCWHNLLPFVQAYRNVMGRDIITGSGIEWIIPLQLTDAGGEQQSALRDSLDKRTVGMEDL